MAQHTFILCLLSLLLFVNGYPFDFFQLVEQWGPNTCNDGTQCHAQPQPEFTIHGLWPSNFSNARLFCATRKLFDYGQISLLQGDLVQYWPDVINGNNRRFWSNEWKKHGACIDPPFNITQYFELSLDHHRTYDLLKILNGVWHRNRQMPNNGLAPKDILNPIFNAINKTAGIRCNKNGITKKLQLHEIVLCFDNNGTTLIDCPKFVSNSCNQPKFVWLLPQQSSDGVPDYA
ncbi:hypothetical protein IC582_009473 [Cucumis melo]|uniref:Ribonuclease MC-like n=1 Tax=Cucumis melo TaxID=3656 RepID=A0ABM3KQU4_CUCME|nr:ribonuclease MC-like [Cucumis melo]